MTPEQIIGTIRTILLILTITLANHNIKLFEDGQQETVVGGLGAVIVWLFSLRAKAEATKKARTQMLVALTPGPKTENDVKAIIASGSSTPSLNTPPNTIPGVPTIITTPNEKTLLNPSNIN